MQAPSPGRKYVVNKLEMLLRRNPKKGYADCMVTEGIERLFPSPSAHSTTVYYHAPPVQNIARLLMTDII
jgi:hypothetical protein